MAIENTYLLGKNITLGCGFDLQAKAPLDSRQTVPAFEGLRALIIGDAAYEGMIVYDEGTKKTYQAQKCESYTVEVDGKTKTYDIAFREFGINEAELKDLIASETTAAMEFKGATATLPENPAKGDMWKATAAFEVAGETTKVGDSIVYNGEEWFRIPSGDDIEDTWRIVKVEGTSLGGIADGKELNLTAGSKLDVGIDAETGAVVYSHEEIDAPTVKKVGDDEGDEPTRTYIASIETDGYGHITGYKTATENVEDTNTTYEFEGLPVAEGEEAPSSVYFQVKSSDAEEAEVIYIDAYTKNEANAELDKKVDKVEGYSLVADDEIARLAEVDNYDDEEVRGLIGDNADAIDELSEYVGTIPNVPGEDGNNKYADLDVIGYINKKAQETLAAAQGGSSETAASVKGQLDDYIGENNTRVKAIEDDVAAIEADYLTSVDKTELSNAIGAEQSRAEGIEAGLRTDVDAIKGDYLKAADIAEFETKANVKKVADDLAAETKARTDADAGFETRIAALEDNFGDGEGTVEAQIAAAVATEKQRAEGIEGGLRTDVNAVTGRMTTAEGKITALEDASAKHALKSELEAVDAKFAGYNTTEAQKAIDDAQDAKIKAIEDTYLVEADIANFETKDNVKKVADDLAEYVEANDKALAGVKATAEAATTVEEVDAQIDAKITALNLGTTYEPIGAEDRAKAYADGLITDANLDQYTTEQEVKDIVDAVIAGAVDGDTITGLANLVEYLNTHGAEAKEMGAAIDVLEGKVETIEGKPAYGITATQISNWDNEVGAKALAETKTTTAEVKDQIEAYKYATDVNAKKYADDAQVAAIADAAGKYETKGTAQGIVDALKLGETYEPIGAETRAIAAAKTETENQVKALADTVYTKTETYTKTEIESLLTWGSF